MTTREAFVAEVLSWEGTPFRWQQSIKGVGCDCLGLLEGAARNIGMPEADSPALRSKDYGGRVPVERLLAGLREALEPADPYVAGNAWLMRFKGRPQHLGVFTGEYVVHACLGAKKPQVLKTPAAVAARWWPIHSAWRFPSLED